MYFRLMIKVFTRNKLVSYVVKSCMYVLLIKIYTSENQYEWIQNQHSLTYHRKICTDGKPFE